MGSIPNGSAPLQACARPIFILRYRAAPGRRKFSTLTMSFADLLFQFMSGEPADRLQHRYRHSLQAVDIINDLCAQPMLLRDWYFSEEHCALTTRLLGEHLPEHHLFPDAQQRSPTPGSSSMPGPGAVWLLIKRSPHLFPRAATSRPRPLESMGDVYEGGIRLGDSTHHI